MGYVSMSTAYWEETADWPLAPKVVYLWSWTNQRVHGISGIGRAADVVVRAETGLSARQVADAWAWLVERGKIQRTTQWFLVLERIRRTCWTSRNAIDKRNQQSVVNFVQLNDVPREIVAAVLERYPELFGKDLFGEVGLQIATGPKRKHSGSTSGGGGAPPPGGRTVKEPVSGDKREMSNHS